MTEIISAIRRGAAELLTRSGGNSASDGGLFDEALNAALRGTQSDSPHGNGRDLPGHTGRPTDGRAVGTQADAPDRGVDFVAPDDAPADDAPADGALSDGDASPLGQTALRAQWRAAYGQLLAPGLAATAREDAPGAVGIPGARDITGIAGDSGATDTEGGSGATDAEHIEDGQIAKKGKAADAIGDARRAAGMGGGSLTPILGLPAGNGAATPTPGAASAGANAVVATAAGGEVVSAEPGPGSAQAAARVVSNAAPGASPPTLPNLSTPSTLSVMSSPTATATASSPSPPAGQAADTAPAGAAPPANTTPAQPGLPLTDGAPALTAAVAEHGGFGAQGESAQETSLPAAATSRGATNDATAPGSVKVVDAANSAPAVPAPLMTASTAGLTEDSMFITAAGATAATTASSAAASVARAATGAGSDAAGSEADGDAASPQIDRAAAEGARADTGADDGSDSRRHDFYHRDFQHRDFQHRDFQHRDPSSMGVIPQGVVRGERPVFEVPREMGRGTEGAAPIAQNPSVTGAERVAPPPTFAPAAPPAPIAGAPAHTPLPAHSQVMQAVGPLLRGADGSYQISLHLDPAGLGRVRVQVEMRGGEVSIQMLAADGGARDMLRDNLDQLRQQFAEMGLKPGSLAVEAGGADGENPWEGLDAHTDDDRQSGGGADTTGHGAGDVTEITDLTIQRGPSGDGALDVRI